MKKGERPITTTQQAGISPEVLRDRLNACLDANKAEDIVIIPMDGKSAIADYMIVASGRSGRHVTALAEHIAGELQTLGLKGRYEGKENGDWVIADAGDIIIHLFRPEVRSFYNLEKMWCDPYETVGQMMPKVSMKEQTVTVA